MEKRHAVTCMQYVHLCMCVLFWGAGTEFELRVDFVNKLLFCVTSLSLRFNFRIFICSTLIKAESKMLDISLEAVDSLILECCKVGVLRVYMLFHILHNVVKDT